MQDREFNTSAIRPCECLKEAWHLIKDDYWLLFAISLVGAVVAGVTVYVLLGAMVCGIIGVYIRKIDGEEVRFENLWEGMRFAVTSIPIALLFIIPVVVYVAAAFFTVYSPLITLAVMGGQVDTSLLWGTFLFAIAIDLVVAVMMTVVHSLIIFAFPLLVDRNLGAMDAIKLSARAAMKNIRGIAGLIVLQFGIVLLGELAFCVGIYLTIPILTANSLVAYRKVFPKLH